MKGDNLIQQKTFNFSITIINLFKILKNEHKEYIISKQLLRSGTSIGANVEEAISAQSTKDFIHKLSIAKKEAYESRYWLKLLYKSNLVDNIELNNELKEIESIINILSKIIKTSSNK